MEALDEQSKNEITYLINRANTLLYEKDLLRAEIKRLQTVLRDVRADLLTRAREYQADDGSPGTLSNVWGWGVISEHLREAAKAGGE